MKNISILLKSGAITCLVFICNVPAHSQNQISPPVAEALIQKNSAAIGLSRTDLPNTRISNAYHDQSGATLIYLQQTFQGIDIDNTIKVLAFKADRPVSCGLISS